MCANAEEVSANTTTKLLPSEKLNSQNIENDSEGFGGN